MASLGSLGRAAGEGALLRVNPEEAEMEQMSLPLMEEIGAREWNEPGVPAGTLGRESGETANMKRKFDDVDDFLGYDEDDILDPEETVMTGFDEFERSVTVDYIDDANAVVGGPTDRKKVTVTVDVNTTTGGTMTVYKMERMFTKQ